MNGRIEYSGLSLFLEMCATKSSFQNNNVLKFCSCQNILCNNNKIKKNANILQLEKI